MSIDDGVRIYIENIFDEIIKDPNGQIENNTKALTKLGIEPDFDSILSYTAGMIFGGAIALLAVKNISEKESSVQFDLVLGVLSRRAWELRELFSLSKFK